MPVTVLKQIRTPAFVGPEHARVRGVVLGRHRGDGLDGASAVERGAQLVAVSCGGELAALARDAARLHVAVPDGFLPRAAIGALVAPLFVALFRLGFAPGAHA